MQNTNLQQFFYQKKVLFLKAGCVDERANKETEKKRRKERQKDRQTERKKARQKESQKDKSSE